MRKVFDGLLNVGVAALRNFFLRWRAFVGRIDAVAVFISSANYFFRTVTLFASRRRDDGIRNYRPRGPARPPLTPALRIGVDPSGSVGYSRGTGGDLNGTPLGTCVLAVFYKMGFAATAANGGNFDITLRVP